MNVTLPLYAIATVALSSMASLVSAQSVDPNPDGASPLEEVINGRYVAKNSNLTEEGFRGMSQGAVNAVMYICGALSVILVAFGIYQLYLALEEQNMMGTADDKKRAAIWSIVIGGLISIPAIIAAIAPYNLVGLGSS